MPQIINTNSLSLLAQNNLNTSQMSLNTAIQRLSSGLRINSAKDDAAGQAIANRFTSNINGLSQAQRNANDGISISQTTEGALKEINNNLQRVRELSVQAANGTNSASDLKSIQDEIKQRLSEIDRTSQQTDFNGVKVLSSTAKTLNIQVGAHDSETIGIALKQIDSSTLGLSSYNINGPQATANWAFAGTSTAAAADYAGNANAATAFQTAYGVSTAVTASTVAEKTANTLAQNLGVANASVGFTTGGAVVDNNGNFFAEISITAGSVAEATALNNEGFSNFTNGSTQTFYVGIDPQQAGAVSAGATSATYTVDTSKLTASDLLKGATPTSLATVDAALKTVDDLRSTLGAVQNRFDSIISNLGTTVTNLSSSRSRIQDADFAVEVSNMTRAQILQQAGTSVLAQANQSTQGVLSLLR
jgi:flagellin